MFENYKKLKKKVDAKIISDVFDISKKLNISQRVLYTSIEIYYKYIFKHEISDRNVFITALILLSTKMADSVRPLEVILSAQNNFFGIICSEEEKDAIISKVVDMEVEISLVLDFSYESTEIYAFLETFSKKENVSSIVAKYTWILLNDSIYLPLVTFFPVKSIIIGCLYIAETILNFKVNIDHTFENFCEKRKNLNINQNQVIFISEELISMYENCLVKSETKNNINYHMQSIEKNL